MKPSQYNYCMPFGANTVFFNGVSEAFFFALPAHAEAYKAIIQDSDDYEPTFHDFIVKMKSDGFIVEDNADEFEEIRKKHHALRKENQYMLMVLPTYECNLRCWYCTQKHENMFMSNETINKLKRLIERNISDDGITEFYLCWFGGEPMLAYDKVLDVTLFSRDLAKTLGKRFYASMTTNATLLNPERIEALREAGLRHYQITIDGPRKIHDSIKKLGKISAYDRTLDNINLIARDTSVSLRFNYTKDNLKPDFIFDDLLKKLNPDVRHNITFSIFKVWQQEQEEIRDEDVDSLFNHGLDAGMSATLFNTGMCYADQLHYDCIFPNGHVAKCDNHSPMNSPGMLMENGSIEWTEDMTRYYEPHIFDACQSECGSCRYLPVCWGPCVSKREKMLRKSGVITCHYKSRDEEMQRLLINLIKTRLQKTTVDTCQ